MPRFLFPARMGVLAVAALAAACGTDPMTLEDDRAIPLPVQTDAGNGLVQEIRLSPAEPRTGDTLRIVSVVKNRGLTTVQVDRRICGFDLRTELRGTDPFGRCGGYSTQNTPIAPGDSVQEHEARVVTSGPGTYALEVRHLLRPEVWAKASVRVQPR